MRMNSSFADKVPHRNVLFYYSDVEEKIAHRQSDQKIIA